MSDVARLVVLISGSGSNLQAILDACQQGSLPAQVVAVISNKAEAYGLQRANNAAVPSVIFPVHKNQTRAEYDRQLARIVSAFKPDWVILAGWMRLLTNTFLSRFPNHVINLHPALPGAFPGTHSIERAYKAWQSEKIPHTGVMVHLVPDEGVDNGPLLNMRIVHMRDEDTLDTFEERMHEAEHELLVETINSLIVHGLERTMHNAKSNSFRS
ncbi:MAG: phosphoribosylglycinamide formyltransferase [Anaerolineales bacterium]|nr:phosphoribosylglycinamide formyltransferase [Anaerolineales bacterium]